MSHKLNQIRLYAGLRVTGAALLFASSLPGCGPDFDPASKLQSLRVIAVRKDDPYARVTPAPKGAAPGTPDNQVDLTVSWQDARPEDLRGEVERWWFGGCGNPAGDQYFACLPGLWLTQKAFEKLGPEQLKNGESWSPALVKDSKAKVEFLSSLFPTTNASLLGAFVPLLDGYSIGKGDRFSVTLPPNLIASHRPPQDPEQPRYGQAFEFFTVCDGVPGIAPEWAEGFDPASPMTNAQSGHPITCFDRKNREEVGADSHVSGYVSVFAYDSLTNKNPVLDGFLFDGKARTGSGLCVNEPCSEPSSAAAAKAACQAKDAIHVPVCSSSDCPQLSFEPQVDQKKNNEVDVASTLAGAGVGTVYEQMWIRFFADRGDLDKEVRLLLDGSGEWSGRHSVKWTVPSTPGPAQLWAVVYDNRGGVSWVRATVCVDAK